jgi:hypothetical protein
MNNLATLTIVFAAASVAALTALHFVSPQFAPSWRMISEYALGRHKWLITTFFLCWGLSSICLAILLSTKVSGIWPILGVILLFVSGVGEIMGGLFDVKHRLHGMAFALGVPTLPVAALLIGYYLLRTGSPEGSETPVTLASHAPWISLVLMGVAMGVMMSGFKKAGIPTGPDMPVPESVPDGVIALAGYANRFLVACYLSWLIVIAAVGLRVS